MRSVLAPVSACAFWLSCSSFAMAQKPKLDEVLKSISESSRGDSQPVNWVPFVMILLGGILAYLAVKHWNRRQAKPKTLHNHTKLLKEAAGAAGVSIRHLKNMDSLAKAQGLSNPLVAILCPSAFPELARHVKTETERKAVNEVAKRVLKA